MNSGVLAAAFPSGDFFRQQRPDVGISIGMHGEPVSAVVGVQEGVGVSGTNLFLFERHIISDRSLLFIVKPVDLLDTRVRGFQKRVGDFERRFKLSVAVFLG